MKRLTDLFVRLCASGAVFFSILTAQVSAQGDFGSAPPCATPASGLVSWWRAEQNALDFSDANHGTLYNGAAFTAGKAGSAFEFDGLDDHVRIPDQPNLRMTNRLTIEGWVKPSAIRPCNFLAKWNAVVGPPLRSYALGMMADGRVYITVSPNGTGVGAGAAFSTNSVPTNEWTYLAGTYDGTALRLYMNGVLQSQVPYTSGIYPGTADLGIACAVGGLAPGDAHSPFVNLFAGSIDELSVYGRALADSEIEAIYTAGSAGKCTTTSPPCAPPPAGLVSWWRAEQDALDFSNANHGTLYNGAAFTAGKSGSAFEFDGLDDHVRIPDQPNLRITNGLTIEGWVKPAAVRHCNFLAKWNAVVGPPLSSYALGMMADGRVFITVSPNGTGVGAGAAFSTNSVPTNEWTYLAGTYDGKALRLYMNGVLQSQVPYTAGIYPGTADLGIACAVGGLAPGDAHSPFVNLFVGSIDELSLYGRALAGSEIEAICTAGSAGKCTTTSLPCAPPPAGLVSWWRAEQNALDFSDANHGTLAGNTAYGTGWVGQAFLFDGSGDGVSVGNPAELQLQDFTIEAWIKRSSLSAASLTPWGGEIFCYSWGGYAFVLHNDGRLLLSKVGYSEVDSSLAVTDTNTFHHVAVTKEGSTVVFYLDGVGETVGPYDPGFVFGGPAAIGARGSDLVGSFLGAIDEVSVYNRALLTKEVHAIYSAGSNGKCLLPDPPTIAQHPAGQSLLVGGTAVFNVSATGTPPLAYQWWFGNTTIANATNTMLVLGNVQLAQAGQYSVLVRNVMGAITSAPALLDVRAVFVRENGQVLPDINYTRIGSATVELWTGFTGGSVFYTLDGSSPSFVSAFYRGPITLQQSATLRAIAYRADFIESGQSVPIHFTITPTYPVVTHTRGGGSVSLNAPTGPYISSTVVTVTATPAVGWTFLEWLGDASGTSPILHLTVNRPKRVEAVFGTTVGTTVAGNGAVLADLVSPYYPYGTAVRLKAVPQAGNTFRVWGNAAGGTVNPLLFTVTNANPVISALFVPLDAGLHALSVIPNGNGKVTIDPHANTYAAGVGVTLIAAPDAGQTFLGWSGDASGTENPLALSMTASKLITANFTRSAVLSVDSVPEWLPVAGCSLTLASEFGVAYQIQVSTNLTEWTPLITLTNVYGRTQFTDEAATQSSHRFYRAIAE